MERGHSNKLIKSLNKEKILIINYLNELANNVCIYMYIMNVFPYIYSLSARSGPQLKPKNRPQFAFFYKTVRFARSIRINILKHVQ